MRKLRPWLEEMIADLAPGAGSMGVLFTSDRGIRRLNHSYRQRDAATDVLSFPGEESPEGRHLGDVVVSVPTARRQARQEGHSVEKELEALLLHGLLHCLGYDHQTDDGTMERLERRLRQRWVRRG
jgi:probable rRNA maturation factor